jgi:hypothetical protein
MTNVQPEPVHALEPDRSLVGEALFLHINDKGVDDDVIKAASVATQQPAVGIIAVRFLADPAVRSLVNGWLVRQRKALAAWKVQEGIQGSQGRLSLRSTVATDVQTGSDWVWAFVQWDPAKKRANG